MERGESRTVEFKASARWNLHRGDRDQAIEREIVKAVAGFMNAHGGTLLIGVNDNIEAVGLENDYKLTRKGNHKPRDSFENWLTDLFDNSIGKPALANTSITFEEVDGHDVCCVAVRPSRKPVYVSGKQTKDFYVRVNRRHKILRHRASLRIHHYPRLGWRINANVSSAPTGPSSSSVRCCAVGGEQGARRKAGKNSV